MPREGLTGSRIRERRSVAGMRQADLARALGISASYLNLIEHNRRRIGGKLLLDIARLLSVEPSMLTEGAEAALIATLRDASTRANLSPAEAERADEFAGRFPGWAEALAASQRRITTLERTVDALTDRLAHDPQLAASVHELLSTAASIRSTASILADEKDIDPVWRERFHTNLNEDSRRLAESSKSLVDYFEAGQGAEDASSSPQDELDTFLEENDYAFAGLETASAEIAQIIEAAPTLRSPAARQLAQVTLERIAQDAQRVSLAQLRSAIEAEGVDPLALARALEVPVSLIFRRLASMPDIECGLVICDRAGSILFRKPVGQMVIPRFASACALWPLFSTLGQPGHLIRTPMVQLGRARAAFSCFATSDVLDVPSYNAAPLLEASMLILPTTEAAPTDALEVGVTCRICPQTVCPARREPSILRDGL